MNYLSVCSGIEAASVAWEPLGWKPVAFCENERFPSSVLAYRFPNVLNLGDMNDYKDWLFDDPIDILVGGTPCQSFSIAGLRGGLEDHRGNLALTYCRILDNFRPRWFVWENVPGVLSSNGGRDFGSIVGAMAELGYGVAWRVLDAQFFGVPQRRRRVFIVGHLGDWRRATEVLFEPGCVRGDSAPSRKQRKDVTGTLASRASAGGGLGIDFDLCGGLTVGTLACNTGPNGHDAGNFSCNQAVDSGHIIPTTQFGPIAGTLTRRHDSSPCHDRGQNVVAVITSSSYADRAGEESKLIPSTGNLAHCLNAGGMGRQDYETETMVGSSFRVAGDGYVYDEGDKTSPLTTGTDPSSSIVAFSGRNRGDDGRGYDRAPNVSGDIAGTIDTVKPGNVAGPTIGVRRLTPVECERLQGFPDDWTLVPHGPKGKPAADGPRYKAIGNSMAVPVMRWIGRRIDAVNKLHSVKD